MIVVDSSVWIDYFTGKSTPATEKLDSLLGDELVAVGDLMLTEVLQGFRDEKDYRQANKLLSSLTIVNMLDTCVALKSAENFRRLRKKGITVRKTIDAIIATYCIENRLSLLHSDKDFQPFQTHLTLKNALAGPWLEGRHGWTIELDFLEQAGNLDFSQAPVGKRLLIVLP